MRTALDIAPQQQLSIRIRDIDRHVDAEVLEDGIEPKLRIHSVVAGLRSTHFDGGVDLIAFQGGERYSLDDVPVEEFDRDKRVLQVAGPVSLRHVRRRSNHREPVRLPVRVARFRGSGLGNGAPEPASPWVDALTMDIGGGGLSAESDTAFPFSAGNNVLVSIALEGGSVLATARAAWIREPEAGRFEIGLAFLQIEDRGHDRLYRYLYEFQRRRMR